MEPGGRRPTEKAIVAVIAVVLAVVLAIDLATPIEVAIWVFYTLAIVLGLASRRPSVPLVTAAVATVFVVAGFFFSPPGSAPSSVAMNRAFGGAAMIGLAVVSSLFVRARNARDREEAVAAAYREKLESALEETQRQAEELQVQQSELEVANDALATASRYKSDFLANMSHELRTPLSSILLLAKQLADNRTKNLSPEQVHWAETMNGAGEDLLGLIDDVLDLARVEAGRLKVFPAPVHLGELAEALVATFEPLAKEKRLALSAQVAPGCPEEITTDLQRVEQILRNLLSNAVKFTEKGEVTLTIRAGDDGGALFEVRDTGTGIAKEELALVFEPFRQADGTASRRHGGTGLGLSISRDLARLLGGEVTVESTVGVGSAFALRLPAVLVSPGRPSDERLPARSLPPEGAERTVSDDDFDGKRILVAEDDARTVVALTGVLEARGAHVVVARNGREVEEALAGEPFHLVLMDVMMPEVDGLEATRRLRADPRCQTLPVIAITARARPEDRKECLDAGASDFVPKPLDLDKLLALVRMWLRR